MTSRIDSTQPQSKITLGKLMFLIPGLVILFIFAFDYWRVRSEVGSLQQEVQIIRKQLETIQKAK